MRNYATALRRVAEGWRTVRHDPTDEEVDARARRFADMADGLSEGTVAIYQQRFRTAIGLYRDPWQIPEHSGRRRSPSRPPPAAPFAGLTDFPFVLTDGTLTRLRLPTQGLAAGDADRLCAYLRTLVVGQPVAHRPDQQQGAAP